MVALCIYPSIMGIPHQWAALYALSCLAYRCRQDRCLVPAKRRPHPVVRRAHGNATRCHTGMFSYMTSGKNILNCTLYHKCLRTRGDMWIVTLHLYVHCRRDYMKAAAVMLPHAISGLCAPSSSAD